jgi:hypothetical protein
VARRTSGAALDAFKSFFTNTDEIQNRFMPAWRLVAARYADRAGVIGFQNMNEPVITNILLDGVNKLYAFHDETIRQLRSVNGAHSVWVEPDVLPSNTYSVAVPRLTSPIDENVVWAPHLYPSLPADADTYDDFRGELGPRLSRIADVARSWKAAAVIGEWSSEIGSPQGAEYVDALHDLANENHIGLANWLWKGYRDQGAFEGDGRGGIGMLYDWDYQKAAWYLNRPGFEHVARPYAIAVPGHIVSQSFDRSTSSYEVSFESQGFEGPAILYVPEHRFPRGFAVELDGTPVEEVTRDQASSRVLVPWSKPSGPHVLRVVSR